MKYMICKMIRMSVRLDFGWKGLMLVMGRCFIDVTCLGADDDDDNDDEDEARDDEEHDDDDDDDAGDNDDDEVEDENR